VVKGRIDRGCEQVVRGRHSVEVPGEVQVDVLHRYDLGVTAPRAASFDPEHRTDRRLAQRQNDVAADLAEPLREAHRRRRLAFPGLRGRDGRGDNDLSVGLVLKPVQDREVDLRLVLAERLDFVLLKAEVVGDLEDGSEGCFLRDLESGLHGTPASRRHRTSRCRGWMAVVLEAQVYRPSEFTP